MKNKQYKNSDDSNRYQNRQSNDWNDDVNNYDQNYRDFNRSNFNSDYNDSNNEAFRRNNQFNSSNFQSGRDKNDNSSDSYGQNNYGRSDYGQSYQNNRGRNANDYSSQYSNDRGNYGNNRNWNRNEYNSQSYNPQERGWWDKTRDEVSSWFGDDDAERRRRMDETKENNHKGKGPKNYKRSQERIKEDINDKLSDDWIVDASDIDVAVSGTEVTLTGTVKSKEAKRRAEDCADAVSGVTHVQNNLRVSSTTHTDTSNKNTPSTEYSARTRKETMNHN